MWSGVALFGCGQSAEQPASDEETAAEPEAVAAEEAAQPETEPEPEPVPSCPEDAWGVGGFAETRAMTAGLDAATWVRGGIRGGWERVRVCRTVDGAEVDMICAPTAGGAECNLGRGDEVCSAQVPNAVLPIVVGQLVDTGDTPTEGIWRCTR